MKKILIVAMAFIAMFSMSACELKVANLGEIFDTLQPIEIILSEPIEKYEFAPDLDSLIASVEVSDGSDNVYDRDQYTSSYQNYDCDKGHECDHEYESIRIYSFYECEWYNFETGIYTDPYNNTTTDTYIGLDYDHIIPLAYADAHGANQWTEEQKKAYADDPFVGVCVNAHDNRSKGAKGPSKWLPKANVEDYCYTWLVIADYYNLSIAPEDMETIKFYLSGVDYSTLSLINEYN